jgi:hypothetical protein
LFDVGVVVEHTGIDEYGEIDCDDSPLQSVYLILTLDGLLLLAVYSYNTHGVALGVGVGVIVGVGVGVGVRLGIQSKQAPLTLEPISVIRVIESTPLIFSNNPS